MVSPAHARGRWLVRFWILAALAFVGSSSASADTFGLTVLAEALDEPGTGLDADLTALRQRIAGTTDPALKSRLETIVQRLEARRERKAIEDLNLSSPLGRELLDQLKQEEQPDRLYLVGDVVLDPTSDSSTALTPALTATYRQRGQVRGATVQYDVGLQIQAAATRTDTLALTHRLLLAGPDGSLRLGLKAGRISPRGALVFSVSGNLDWLNARAGSEALSSFAYHSLTLGLIGRLGPVVGGILREFREVPGEQTSTLARAIDKARSDVIAIGLTTDGPSITLRYLLDTNRPRVNNENLEIRFGVAYAPF